MAKPYVITEHKFGPTDTIYGAIKKYNSHYMTDEELNLCRVYYMIENKERVQKVGEMARIPVLNKYKNESQ